jgi:bacteriorhodopsin
MFVGMLYFIARGWGIKDERRQKFYIATILIAAIAFANYLAMATGFALIEVTVGGETLDIYWARYSDWLFTTPLLLYDLALLAGADRNTIATLVGINSLMIGTGAVATLAQTNVLNRLIFWGVSTGFLLVELYILFDTLTEQARSLSGAAQSKFTTLRNVLIALWLVYPVWWLVGTESTLFLSGTQGLVIETAGFAVLDVTAKIIFGFILLQSHEVLDAAGAATEAASPADD